MAKHRKSPEHREAGATHDATRAAIGQDPELAAQLRRFGTSFIIDLARCERTAEKIDQIFAGQPFFPDEPPTSLKNRRRFREFWDAHGVVEKRKVQLVHELMRTRGIDPNHPEQMWQSGGPGVSAASPAKPGETHNARTLSEEDLELVKLAKKLQEMGPYVPAKKDDKGKD